MPAQANLFPTTWATPKTNWTWDSRSHRALGSKRGQHCRKGSFMALCENVPHCKRVQSHFGHEEGAVLAGMAWNRINKKTSKGGEERGENPLFVAEAQQPETKDPVAGELGGWKRGAELGPFSPLLWFTVPPPSVLFPSAMPAHTKSSLSSAPCLSLPLCGASECRTVRDACRNGNGSFC